MASYRWLGAASSLVTLFLLLLLGSAHSLDTSGQGLAVVTVEQSPEMLFETQTVTLTCLIDGAGVIDANYTWLRDGGVELTEAESNVMLLGNQLNISNVSVSEWDGVCIACQAVTMTTMGSGSINLTVTTRSPTFTQHPANITVNKGANFTLNCSAIGLPDPTIVLLENGRPVQNFIAEEISNGVYLFTNADDSFVPGNYVCRATNINGVACSYTATIVVRFAPELETQPEMTDILLGQSGLLNCTARGSPKPVISWTKNGEPLDLDDGRLEIVENGSLFLRDVRLNDTGDYKCNATNELGFDESDDAMLMINMYPMFVEVPGRMVHVELGDSITLECDAMAFPPANYFWFLVNCSTMVIIESITTGNGLHVSEGVLTIESAMRSDRGCYRCVANNSLESSDINHDTTLKVSAPPLPPMVRVDEIGSSWINIAWTEVDNYPTIVNYLVEYRLSNISPNFTPVDDSIPAFTFSYNITSLYPSAMYDVRVKARSPRGVGDPSPVVNATTLEGIPLDGRPENVRYNFTSPTSVNVSWTVPEVLLLTSYVRASVELRDVDGGMFVMEGVMDATFTGLTPATQYTLTLIFIFAGELSGPASSQTIITPDDVPGDAPNITSALATGPTTLLFTWTPPTVPNGNITYYNITTLPSTPSQPHLLDGSMMSYEIGGLRAFTDYTISLSASTSAGEGPANTTQVRTLEDVPPAPSAPDIIPLNSTSLLVSWGPLASVDVPGILVNYTVKYNQLHHGHHPSYEVVPASETEITLVNLCPYTMYRVSVAAATGAGNGNFSDHTDSRTFGAIPEVKVQLRGLRKACPAGLLVEWEELRTKVLYGPIEEIMLVVNYSNLESGISNTSNISYYNGNTSYILEGLDVFTNYSVSVALSNINGTGPFSDPSTNVSCDGVAPAPEITNLTAISSTAVQVSWQPPSPEDVPGMIVNYIIMYAADGAERMIASPESSTLVISGLSPYTTYTVSIATETRYNTVGSFSDTWLVRTLGAVPDDLLTILSVSPSCPHFGLDVQWLRPNTSSFHLLCLLLHRC